MSKSVMRYMSETINGCRNSDEDCIRACVSMDSRIYQAIKDYEEKKNQPLQENNNNPTVTVDDIKKEMMRPMINDDEISEENNIKEDDFTR